MNGGILIAVKDHRRELFYGLIRIHVLLHAQQEPIFGLGMMRELAHHGYRIGPGTLYPLLHGLERGGLLKGVAGRGKDENRRKVYGITTAGTRALKKAKEKVDELHHELHEKKPRRMGKAGNQGTEERGNEKAGNEEAGNEGSGHRDSGSAKWRNPGRT